MLKRILVAFDDSESAHRGFDLACGLAEKFGSHVLLLSLIRLPEPSTSLEIGAILDEAREHYAQAHGLCRARAAARGVDIETAVEVGHPAEHIVGRAERDHYDMIVIGRRGRTSVARWVLGSVSEKVLGYAHCPVLVIK